MPLARQVDIKKTIDILKKGCFLLLFFCVLVRIHLEILNHMRHELMGSER